MRLIDADALKEKLLKERDAIPKTFTERYGFVHQNHHGDAIRGGIRKALRCMEQTPTIDAVPVCRCKDCIHWLNEDGLDDHVCLKIYSDGAVSFYAWQNREPDDFCSYGEKRGDG